MNVYFIVLSSELARYENMAHVVSTDARLEVTPFVLVVFKIMSTA